MNIEQKLARKVEASISSIWGKEVPLSAIQIQDTRPEFEGDYTVVTFALGKFGLGKPQESAQKIGEYLLSEYEEISGFEVVKGFLNVSYSDQFWINYLKGFSRETLGVIPTNSPEKTVIEFSSPNTNKPLHLGHLRNNFIGDSVARILQKNGNEVVKVCLYNDRGIAICKSMVMYKEEGKNLSPDQVDKKGDFFVVGYYVKFGEELKLSVVNAIEKLGIERKEAEVFILGKYAPGFDLLSKEEVISIKKKTQAALEEKGKTVKELEEETYLMMEAREMLRKWEKNDSEVRELWKKMNGWVYEGFNKTYDRIKVSFDNLYFESETYLLGNDIVEEGLNNNTFYKKEDGSIWVDLSEEGLDQKVLRRSDGTSMYITQDLGTAQKRFEQFQMDKGLYVVADEQNYHFKVLFYSLKKLGRKWADGLVHLSYGMVDLPHGKMKTREGTSVDADLLMDEVIKKAKDKTDENTQQLGLDKEGQQALYETIGIGALKYYILKVNPQKRMVFDPEESVSIEGNSGPFIQYAYARVNGISKNAGDRDISNWEYSKLEVTERKLIKQYAEYASVIKHSGEQLDPSFVAAYLYELARNFNRFFHNVPVLKAGSEDSTKFRLYLSSICGDIIKDGMSLLGINVPDRM